MRYKKITIDVEEDDGTETQRIVELDGTMLMLDVRLVTDFNIKNSSETFSLFIERITRTSIEYANSIKNPFWK